MDVNNLKYVVGAVAEKRPAIIRFFGPVNYETCKDFNEEFLWLQSWNPSKIVVLINSEGGSVIHGMSTFSVINSCPIDTECVVEGIAASMGSVIWAAGKRLYMHDYSLLMIHNPFCYYADPEDENTQATIKAFKEQIATIYSKRFGLDKDTVQKIMDGEPNVDGTYLSAKEAVAKGIIDKSHIIKTSKHVRDEIKAKIEGVSDLASLRDIMAHAADADRAKLVSKIQSILEQNEKNSLKPSKMEDKDMTLCAISAQLGFSDDSQLASVTNRIAELVKAEGELQAVKASVDELTIKLTGKEAEVANLSEKLTDVESKLQEYKDAEKAAHQKAVEAMVEDAINEGRITADAKETWVQMASANFELVKNTLATIPAREKITEKIAEDVENRQDAKDNLTDAEKEIKAKIDEVVGSDFSFLTLED